MWACNKKKNTFKKFEGCVVGLMRIRKNDMLPPQKKEVIGIWQDLIVTL